MLDRETMLWALLPTTGTPPTGRHGHAITRAGNKLWMFGGVGLLPPEKDDVTPDNGGSEAKAAEIPDAAYQLMVQSRPFSFLPDLIIWGVV